MKQETVRKIPMMGKGAETSPQIKNHPVEDALTIEETSEPVRRYAPIGQSTAGRGRRDSR